MMTIKIRNTSLPEVQIIEPEVSGDQQGFVVETHNRRKYQEFFDDIEFVQDNHSHSCKNTLRGLHYQLEHAQARIVYVISGKILDVAVDIRRGSPTFGEWTSTTLSHENHRQVFIPEGFAHGFCILSETADVIHKCSNFYDPNDSYGILWSDPKLNIDWPIEHPILSETDQANPTLDSIDPEILPVFVQE